MKYNPMLLWEMKLEDGTEIEIRPITYQDIELEKQFFEELSEASRHYRFIGGISGLSDEAIADLCNIDYFHDMAFVAVTLDALNKKIVGVGRYAEDKEMAKHAEFAVTVADEFQNHGIGTELLKRMIDFAKLAGMKRLYSIASSSNKKMMLLANQFNFSSKTDPDNSAQIIYELDVTDL